MKRLLFVIIILLLFLPKLGQLPWIRDSIITLLNKNIEGRLSVKALTLSWPGPQSFHDVHYVDSQGDLLLTAGELSVTNTLVSCIECFLGPKCDLDLLIKDYILFGNHLRGIEPLKLHLGSLKFSPVSIGSGSTESLKLILKKGESLKPIFNVLNEPIPAEFNIWTTPIFFHLDKGVIHLQRVDLLALGKFHLALWGKVNLNKYQGQFMLGVPSKLLSLKDEVELVPFPLKVSKKGITIDEKKALTQLALRFLGGEELPPPNMSPFPWEK